MIFALFKAGEKKGYWQFFRELKADSFSSVLISQKMSPKKIKFKRAKGSGDNKRLESITFKFKGEKYKIVNCLQNGYFD